ncbi:tRNA1(Val) (adenine(37)-N6)-methyltransferase [Sedimentitalea todarodis]|uniref:Methyltransferase n=1 Tax=Sedimentitalea todarodis TaxID=1631240 RepID=A0ABU3VHZ0_9RHOB|nr:methyltransferase [Sedimentitalea todarodis]MDU9005811.1 methyltransferase [Sedimentitalea todarodis]
MSAEAIDDLTRDAFLGGRLHLFQPRNGYRAGVDPVLLAATVNARPGQAVLDLGCGAGAAALCLATRVPGLELWGVELQPLYADLAQGNGLENGVAFNVVASDLNALPEPVRSARFDHVIANPPYYSPGAHSVAQNAGRGVALSESDTPLEDWLAVAARRLAPRGYLHMIQRADRLPDMLAGCVGRLGSVEVLPLSAREGRAPGMVILRARKDGRAPFRLHAPCLMHVGTRHERDADSYSAAVSAILRDGQALEWPDG